MDPESICFQQAKEATEDMVLRELPEHLCVGPMPEGVINILTPPIRELLGHHQHFFIVVNISDITIYLVCLNTHTHTHTRLAHPNVQVRHFIDIVHNIPAEELDHSI